MHSTSHVRNARTGQTVITGDGRPRKLRRPLPSRRVQERQALVEQGVAR